MKLAVMQPYLFPYIGYYQLIAAVDRFAILDDVAYILGGWINRNRILLHGKPHRFTVPLHKASPNQRIHDIAIADVRWQKKFFATLSHAYCKAPYYEQVRPLIDQVLLGPAVTIDQMAFRSIEVITEYLNINTFLIRSTRRYGNEGLKGKDRIIDICIQENADTYINAPGGRSLYDADSFAREGIELRFLLPVFREYRQFAHVFVPALSIIDVLMFNDQHEARDLIFSFETENETN